MINRKVSHGFTLIELTIVIIVLGIISAIAIPRFVNLSSDARVNVLESIEGNMRSIASIVHMKV